MKRINQYFTPEKKHRYRSYASVPPILYRQERDWTCSIACLRSLLSALDNQVASENDYINHYQLECGPHYTDEIITKNMFVTAKKSLPTKHKSALFPCLTACSNKNIILWPSVCIIMPIG